MAHKNFSAYWKHTQNRFDKSSKRSKVGYVSNKAYRTPEGGSQMATFTVTTTVTYSFEVEAEDETQAEAEGWNYEDYGYTAQVDEIVVEENDEDDEEGEA